MISQRYKLYLLAFVIYTTSAVLIGALELLALRYGDAADLARLVTTYSGSFLGGFALVLGILRDDRAERERQRAERAEKAAKKSADTANQAKQQAEQWQQQAEQERQRADRAEAELARLRSDQQYEARFRRLEEALGLTPEVAAENDDRTE